MNRKLFWLLVISLALPGCASSSQPHDFAMEAYKSNRIAVINWQVGENEIIERYIVYIEQGNTERFPKNKVAETDTNHWESKQRKTFRPFYQWLHLDIRDPSQWTDTQVITPGEIYTVGIEKDFSNGEIQRAYTVLIPCEQPIASSSYNPDNLQPIDLNDVDSLRSEIFSPPFVQQEQKLLFELKGKKNEIIQIHEDQYYYFIVFDDSNMIKCEKSPTRPALYGNETLIVTIWKFLLICVATLLLYATYITGKAVHYLNFLAQQENNPKAVFKTILSEEKSSVFIIYAIVLITQNYFSSKLIRLLIAELVEGNKDLISGIEKIINAHKIYQLAQIRVSILNFLQ